MIPNLPNNQKLELAIGHWKEVLHANDLQIAIAITLNHCAKHHRMQLLGYLVTDKKISLIIEGGQKHVENVLAHFYHQFVVVVGDHLKLIDTKGHICEKWQKHKEGELSDLFDKSLLHDPILINLLLGQKIGLPYYSAAAEAMKKEIRKYNYCSAIDYSGAEGPVKVKTSWNNRTAAQKEMNDEL